MGFRGKCDKCGKSFRVSSDEIRDVGTSWDARVSIKCPFCGHIKNYGIKGYNYDEIEENLKKNPKNTLENIEQGNILEYWAQQYFNENFKEFGFDEIQGPFDIGPDFKGKISNKWEKIEIERHWQNYFEHNHHTNPKFKGVKYLILIDNITPPTEKLSQLPEIIKYFDSSKFYKWGQPRFRHYAIVIKNVGSEMTRRLSEMRIENCGDKERDMSTCPDCRICPYNSEDNSMLYRIDSSALGKAFAEFFMKKYDIYSESFKMTDVKNEDLEEFFNTMVRSLM